LTLILSANQNRVLGHDLANGDIHFAKSNAVSSLAEWLDSFVVAREILA